MKRKLAILGALLATHLAFGQGTFVYDQQSSDVNHFDGDDSVPIPFWGAPPVQSFTPSLSGIGFIEVWGMDIPTFTALAVNLRESSPDGAILGTTSTVTLPRGTNYSGPLSFLCPGQISLVSGQVYYMEPFMVKPAGYGTCKSDTGGRRRPRSGERGIETLASKLSRGAFFGWFANRDGVPASGRSHGLGGRATGCQGISYRNE